MKTESEMLRTDEARELMQSVRDPITQHFLNHAMHHLLRKFHAKQDRPVSDFDLLYFMELMRDIFADHNVLQRILNGELVGALYYDEE